MKTNKRVLSVLLFLFTIISYVAADSEKITVSKIKIFVDDVEIGAELEDGEIEPFFSENTILSFTSLRSGKSMSVKAFENECKQTELRLLASGYFYTARVDIVPPRKNPEKRSVIISVTKGFLPRFGGGPIYGMYGRVGIKGKRQQLIGVAGYNVNGASYLNENLFGLPLIAGANLYINAPACFVTKTPFVVDGQITLGGFITPDLRVCTDICSAAAFQNNFYYMEDSLKISPYVSFEKYISTKMYTSSEIRMYWSPLVGQNSAKGKYISTEAAQTFDWNINRRITFATVVSGGTSIHQMTAKSSPLENKEDFTNLPASFSLSYNKNNISSNSGLINRSVRAGYSEEELSADNYVLASCELRILAFSSKIPPIYNYEIIPFVFADAAYTEKGMLDAFGAGIQVHFDCPVFLYLNFNYGINHLGRGQFYFSARKSF